MKTKVMLSALLLLMAGLLGAYDQDYYYDDNYDMYGAFRIVTKPKGADVNLYDIDLYLSDTPTPVYPVYSDEYMELREGIPGRSINIIITKDGYVPLKKTIFVPFLYSDPEEAVDNPTVFTFRLKRDYVDSYYDICYYYSWRNHRPRPEIIFYPPGPHWYPAPPGGYLPYPPDWDWHHGGNHGGDHGGGTNPPGPPSGGGGEHPGSHGGGPGANPPSPPGGGSGDGGHTDPPGGGGYGGDHGGYTPPNPPGGSGGSSYVPWGTSSSSSIAKPPKESKPQKEKQRFETQPQSTPSYPTIKIEKQKQRIEKPADNDSEQERPAINRNQTKPADSSNQSKPREEPGDKNKKDEDKAEQLLQKLTKNLRK
jgi:hypothetical protein